MVDSFLGRKYDYTPMNAAEERYRYLLPQQKEDMRNEIVMDGLRSLSRYLGTLRDGRKTVLFVSEGFISTLPTNINSQGLTGLGPPVQSAADQTGQFFNSVNLQGDMRAVYADANRNDTAIYTLDPRGLATTEFDVSDPAVGAAEPRGADQRSWIRCARSPRKRTAARS